MRKGAKGKCVLMLAFFDNKKDKDIIVPTKDAINKRSRLSRAPQDIKPRKRPSFTSPPPIHLPPDS
jgi:hypothetical protein